MKTFRFRIRPSSAFATPLHGDTLFGQLCWAVLRREGESNLQSYLSEYLHKPFVVLSDAFPADCLPKPHLPLALLGSTNVSPKDRKQLKKKKWIPLDAANQPVNQWLTQALSDEEVLFKIKVNGTTVSKRNLQMHNSINRLTGTTGAEGFAPYGVETSVYQTQISLDLYAVLDDEIFDADTLRELIGQIGEVGYGKDANIGAGRFSLESVDPVALPHHHNANAFFTLGHVAPQGLNFNSERSYYQPFTRYGRHGDWAAFTGHPFKSPILLAKAGSVFTPTGFTAHDIIGQGLGGNGSLSKAIPETIHQGYAPVIGINMQFNQEADV